MNYWTHTTLFHFFKTRFPRRTFLSEKLWRNEKEKNEKEKKKQYNERVLQIEYGSFTPLVMSANGGFAREAKKFYSRLAELVASKRNIQYSVASVWIKRKISFSFMNSIGLYVRGSRSVFCNGNIKNSMNNDPVASESLVRIMN